MIGKLTSSAYSTARMQGRSKLVKYQDVAQVVNGSEAKNWFYLSGTSRCSSVSLSVPRRPTNSESVYLLLQWCSGAEDVD